MRALSLRLHRFEIHVILVEAVALIGKDRRAGRGESRGQKPGDAAHLWEQEHMKLIVFISATLLAVGLAGCVVAPVEPTYMGPPPGVVYVAPTYPTPGPGYAWSYHGNYGWGWYHPGRGWHRGWR
jgi:hypothetical protein